VIGAGIAGNEAVVVGPGGEDGPQRGHPLEPGVVVRPHVSGRQSVVGGRGIVLRAQRQSRRDEPVGGLGEIPAPFLGQTLAEQVQIALDAQPDRLFQREAGANLRRGDLNGRRPARDACGKKRNTANSRWRGRRLFIGMNLPSRFYQFLSAALREGATGYQAAAADFFRAAGRTLSSAANLYEIGSLSFVSM